MKNLQNLQAVLARRQTGFECEIVAFPQHGLLLSKSESLKGEYDSVSDEMGSIYYKGFSEEEIAQFEECLDRIRKNLEEWQKS